jgi:hypothetical protein
MTKAHDRFRILLVDPDDLLAADADALAHPEIEFISSPIAAASALPAGACDVMVMSIDAPAALDLLATICARGAPPVIALAGRGWPGRPLEFVLTLAELRGAALGLPKPIDALELALAAAEIIARTRPQDARPSLVRGLQRKLAG